LGDVLFRPQSTSELAGNACRLNDSPYAGAVYRPALFGSIEVNEVQIVRTLTNPAAGHGGGIVAEDRFLVIIALPQPDALSAAQVNGRQNPQAFSPFDPATYGSARLLR
jgi:hypothetical protein